MGALLKLVDSILLLFFMVIALAAPLIGAQSCLPITLFPTFLVDLKERYTDVYGDYLLTEERPHFFVGIVWLEILFQWPLALINIFAILASKSGSLFNTTCLIYGSSVLTSMAAILAELIGSGKAGGKLMAMYYPFMGFAVLAMLRGLVVSQSSNTASSESGKRPPALGGKKTA